MERAYRRREVPVGLADAACFHAHAQRFPGGRLTLLRERLRSSAEALPVTTAGATAGHARP
ncbi:uncharacterized protein SOCEGT47_049680 [Sorangium cellulosum]|uniref:Uncharacterized protein n=1 Tax=Sorangium cellulosum TaxID=56 RepID=A0A4P2Q4Y0_SORCE|nr:uncharacterized protein SOCEGT47_049680 [Sorangium cellulosum]